MPVADIKKINIIGLQKDKDLILDIVHDLGVLNVAFGDQEEKLAPITEESSDEQQKLDYSLAQVKFAIDFLSPFYEGSKIPFLEKLRGGKILLTRQEFIKTVQKFNYPQAIKEAENLEEEINKTQGIIDKCNLELEIFEKWASLDISLAEVHAAKTTKAVFGTVASDQYLEFLNETEKKIKKADIHKVTTHDNADWLFITYHAPSEEAINKIFYEYGFENIDLPKIDRTPKQELDRLKNEIKNAEDVLNQQHDQVKKIAKESLNKLKIIFDYTAWKEEELEVSGTAEKTRKTFSITGWVQTADIPYLRKKLDSATHDFEIIEIKPKEDEAPPVIIKNRDFLKPFESVTSIYGMPRHFEYDPTPFLAPFFIIFFALCLTDAGYGILLAVIAWLGIKIFQVPKENQKLFRLLIYGGIVTFVIGALFGGWFGIVLEDLPESLGWLQDILIRIRQINPIEEPLTVLMLTFVLGIIQVMTGITINLVYLLKQKKVVDAILDSGLWLYFISSLIFWALVKVAVLPESLGSIATILLLIGAGALVLTQGRKAKNIFLKFGQGVLSLYNVVGYFSDVLSYSRLLALGLATGIIAMVINMIAGLAIEMIPYAGYVLAVIILIGGHMFNLAINVLGAYIHSGRLQFVEFFPKFMEGGGTRFKPFLKESTYVKITS